MRNYTEEEKAALLQAARETLARSTGAEGRDNFYTLVRPKPAPGPQQHDNRLTDFEAQQLRNELTTLVASERAFFMEVLQTYLPELYTKLRKEISEEIQTEINQLVADINNHNRAAAMGTVVDVKRGGTVTELKRKPAA